MCTISIHVDSARERIPRPRMAKDAGTGHIYNVNRNYSARSRWTYLLASNTRALHRRYMHSDYSPADQTRKQETRVKARTSLHDNKQPRAAT